MIALALLLVTLETGRYEGTLRGGPETMPMAIDVAETDGRLTATIDLAAERIVGHPLADFRFEAPTLRFRLPNLDGDFVFEGQVENGTIEGEFGRGQRRGRVELRRVGPVPTPPFQVIPAEFASGERTVRGELLMPPGTGRRPCVVLLHGSSTPSRHDFRGWAVPFARRGVAALIFDKRSLGGPLGGDAPWSLRDYADDALAAVSWLGRREDVDPKKIALFGFSEGGLVAPLTASLAPERIACLVSVSGPGESLSETMLYQAGQNLRAGAVSESEIERARTAIRKLFDAARTGQDSPELAAELAELRRAPWAWRVPFPMELPSAADRSRLMRWRNLDFDPIPYLRELEMPLLFVLGDADQRIDATIAAHRLEEALGDREDVEIKRFPGGNHELSSVPDAAEQVAEWLVARLAPQKR